MNTNNKSQYNKQSSSNPIAFIAVFQGSQNLYYSFAGVNYDYRFPIEFVLNHELNFGGLCESCMSDGCINGVFIGYCAKCIDELYGLEAVHHKGHGNGMLPGCIERKGWMSGSYYDPARSIWATYMKPTIWAIDGIGCESLCDNMTYMPQQEPDQEMSCCEKTNTDNDATVQEEQQHEKCCITVDDCDDSCDDSAEMTDNDDQEYDDHQEYDAQDCGKRMLIEDLNCETMDNGGEMQSITSQSITSQLPLAAEQNLKRAIANGQVAVRDRIKHTAMYCGNN